MKKSLSWLAIVLIAALVLRGAARAEAPSVPDEQTPYTVADDGDTAKLPAAGAAADEKFTVTVSAEELYTGSRLTVNASNPDAEAIRIYERRWDLDGSVVAEAEGGNCEYEVTFNVPASLKYWAEARYDGAWSGAYSEEKAVTYISRGELDAPTFSCGTEFGTGEAITVTRTNHVENEETCLLFLSTEDHSRTLINGRSFNGEDTLTIQAPDEAGEYILSVLVMASGWTNNQTDLTISVTGEGGSGEISGEVGGGTWTLKDHILTFSGPVDMGSWELTGDIQGCREIEKVVFGSEVLHINPQFCSYVAYPASMEVDPDNAGYCSVDGVVYTRDGTVLVCYPAGKQDADFTVPSGVTAVGETSFTFVSSLKTLVLPEGVTEIGSYAFNYCRMEEVSFPASLQSIGYGAFRTTESLRSVAYAGTVEQWGGVTLEQDNSPLQSLTVHCTDGDYATEGESGQCGADLTYELDYATGHLAITGSGPMFANPFTDNKKIVTAVIGEGATSISRLAFASCRNMVSIGIPSTVTALGDSAFSNCESLTGITIPAGVTSFGNQVFMGCSSLKEIVFLGTEAEWQALVAETDNTWPDGCSITCADTGAGEGPVILSQNLQLSGVGTEYDASTGYLRISGTVDGPSEVCEIRIASWTGEEPTADEALSSAQAMVSVWKQSTASFPQETLPLRFGSSCPIDEEDLGKPIYVVLAGMDTGVNLVGCAVVRTELPGEAEKKEIRVSVSPQQPVLGQSVTISWDIIGYEDIEDPYMDVLLFSGNMVKYVNVPVDLASNRSGSVSFTPEQGESMTATVYFISGEDYVSGDSGRIPLSGEVQPREPIAVSVSYRTDDQQRIVADYAISGGAGSYEIIRAEWVRLGGEYIVNLHNRQLDAASGQLVYAPPSSGEYALMFTVLDSEEWEYVQGTITGSITVSGIEPQALGIAFPDGVPSGIEPNRWLKLTWDVTGGDGNEDRQTAVRAVTDDGIVLAETSSWGYSGSFARRMSGLGGGSRSVTISLTPMDSTGEGQTVTVTIPVLRAGRLTLPEGLTAIEEEAFLGTAAHEIDIPDSVTRIGEGAIPEGVTLIVGSGSWAESWAEENGYAYTVR